jgi:3-hydroxyisobutyrate dehydrogenase-like beta-hydroxyacid dehydrogenase
MSDTTRASTLGFVGLGIMGSRMVGRLLAAGHRLVVHDAVAAAGEPLLAKGAHWADDPAAVAAEAGTVLLSLPGPPEVREVVLGSGGLVERLTAGDLVIDLSTNAPHVIREIAAALRERTGATLVDAPVTGGGPGAEHGTLAIMVGAEPDIYERALPILRHLGSEFYRMGPAGAGATTKLINNITTFIEAGAMVEHLTLAVKNGADVGALLALFRSKGKISPGLESMLKGRLFKGQFSAPTFRMALAHKDARLAVESAAEMGTPLRFGAVAESLLRAAHDAGHGDDDLMTLAFSVEKEAGVQLRFEI